MDGLRIRTMTLPTHEAIINSLGGQPTPLPWAEVYTALQTGVADGQMNKVIAADLGISERTVEVHRGQVMKKLEVRTLAQLVRVKIDMEQNAAA